VNKRRPRDAVPSQIEPAFGKGSIIWLAKNESAWLAISKASDRRPSFSP
jgi:hypothetical protein